MVINGDPIEAWSQESFSLARKEVYLNGDLKGGLSKENAPLLPDNYGKRAKTIGEQRVYMASFRLLELI